MYILPILKAPTVEIMISNLTYFTPRISLTRKFKLASSFCSLTNPYNYHAFPIVLTTATTISVLLLELIYSSQVS